MKKILKAYIISIFLCVLTASCFCAFTLAKQNTSKMMFASEFDKVSVFSNEPVMIAVGGKTILPGQSQRELFDKYAPFLRTILPVPVNAVWLIGERAAAMIEYYR